MRAFLNFTRVASWFKTALTREGDASAAIPCTPPGGAGRPAGRPVLFSALFAASLLAGCATTPPSNQENACAIFAEKRSWWDAVRDTERRWGASPALQLAFIKQESSFDADARPKRGRFLFVFPGARPSSAYGYAQATDPTWERYKRDRGGRFAQRDSFRDASDFIGWYVKQTRRHTGVRINDPYRQYLAYHEGWSGYKSGSWRRKGELKRIARRVADRTDRYDRQLKGCRKRLSRRFLGIL